MRRISQIVRHESGSAAVEAAFVLPVLLAFIIGLIQLGFVFQANAGMHHGLGEAARFATIFPTPSDAAISRRLTDSVFGTASGTMGEPVITTPEPTDCEGCRDLSITYEMPVKFLFLDVPDIEITRSKRIYIAD